MTAQYNGNGFYTIYLENREIIISQDEINEIQSWNFPNNSEIEKTSEELEDDIEELKDKNSSIAEKIDEAICDFEEEVIDEFEAMKLLTSQYEALKRLNA